jgi:cation:H+ antiporter
MIDPMNLLYIVLGLLGLFFGGNWLVQGASRLAASLGVSALIIGVTIVAFGTSMPEMLVGITAAARGASDIAIGNVIGSNIANIGLILALAGLVLVIPIHIDLIKREIPVVIGGSVLVWLMALDGQISGPEGGLLVLGLILFNIVMIRAARRERLKPDEERELQEEEHITGPINRWLELGRIVVGLAVLLVGAELLVNGAVAVARALQVSELVIGVTLVAVGTSLPELVTSVIAAARRHEDILFGNVVGSNIFNLFGILGVTALVRPIPVADQLFAFDFPVMLGFALVLVVFGLRGRLPRWASALLLLAYIGFIVYSVVR